MAVGGNMAVDDTTTSSLTGKAGVRLTTDGQVTHTSKAGACRLGGIRCLDIVP